MHRDTFGRVSMTLEGIIVGLFAILIGGAFCFAGFKWFLNLLPNWGFQAG